MSGMLAAHYAVRVLREGADSTHAALAYRSWTGRWFEYDVDALRARYQSIAAFAETGRPSTADGTTETKGENTCR
jgi:hypothetical protein